MIDPSHRPLPHNTQLVIPASERLQTHAFDRFAKFTVNNLSYSSSPSSSYSFTTSDCLSVRGTFLHEKLKGCQSVSLSAKEYAAFYGTQNFTNFQQKPTPFSCREAVEFRPKTLCWQYCIFHVCTLQISANNRQNAYKVHCTLCLLDRASL